MWGYNCSTWIQVKSGLSGVPALTLWKVLCQHSVCVYMCTLIHVCMLSLTHSICCIGGAIYVLYQCEFNAYQDLVTVICHQGSCTVPFTDTGTKT